MSNIDQLKTRIAQKGGFANPHRFNAYIYLTQNVSSALSRKGISFGAQGTEFTNISCESVTFPGKQIETADYSTYRNKIKMPTGFINDEVNITFRLTEDMYLKNVFDAWQEYIIDPETYQARYRSEYVSNIELMSLDKGNLSQHNVLLVDCFPVTVGGIEKSNESTDEVLKLQVTFACKDVVRAP